MRVTNAALLVALTSVIASGCAIRLGGPKPEMYNATGLRVGATESAADAAARIKNAQADFVLMSAPRDSAWFADVSKQSGLVLTRPGHTGPTTLALLTKLTSLGDTALVLPIANGGRLHVKDALYKVDKDRSIDLMLVSFEEATAIREGVRTLLNYIATDVGGTSAVVIGIQTPNAMASDSVSALVRAAFANALECGGKSTPSPAGGLGISLFYGPEARLSCSGSHVITGTPNAVVARVVVER